VQEQGFVFLIYYTSDYNDQLTPSVIQLAYEYQDDLQDFQLLKEVKTVQNEDYSWTKNVSNFKTNKILFKDSWHSEIN